MPFRSPARLVVLVSGTGTNLRALMAACTEESYGAQVVAVGADRHGTAAVEHADAAGLATFVHRVGDFEDRGAWDAAMADTVAGFEPDLVVSAGFMKLAGETFLDRFGGRYLNTHPALLPSFPGMHGVADALAHGVKVTGATLFVVDAGVDTGPIVAQTAVEVAPDDDESSLHARIKAAESRMLVEHVGRLARDDLAVADRPDRKATTGP